MMKLCNTVCLMLMVLGASAGWSADHRVSSADDIESVMETAQPGDTLTMAQGVWADQEIMFHGYGTEEAPILLRAEKPGHVVLTGESRIRIGGSYLIVDGLRFINGYTDGSAVISFKGKSEIKAYDCRVTNTAIVNYNPENSGKSYKWVELFGQRNRFDHCFLYGKAHDAATLVVWMKEDPDYHRIDHNYFGYRPPLGMNGGETIRIGTSDWSMYDSRCTVEYNLFEACDGEIEIISNKGCENIYRYNTFSQCDGMLTLRHGNRCEVYGNFFLGSRKAGSGGVRVIGEDHKVYNNYFQDLAGTALRSALTVMNGVPNSPLNRYFQVQRAEIAHNTIVNCASPLILGAGADSELSLPPLDCVIANNVIQSQGVVAYAESTPVNLTWAGNVFWGQDFGLALADGVIWQSPELVLADDGLYRPAAGSPVVDGAADGYDHILRDMDGQIRGQAPDAGADEVSGDAIENRPLTADDVGPAWMHGEELPYSLSLLTGGSGSVSLNPSGGLYEAGSWVKLTAVPDDGQSFLGWGGALTGTALIDSVLMDDHKVVTAQFTDPRYFSVFLWITGSGEVDRDPELDEYSEGSSLLLTAQPADGWRFNAWGGSLSGSENPVTLTMDANKTVVASFIESTPVFETAGPDKYALHGNYPNPFNPQTRIVYDLPRTGRVELTVFDSKGQCVEVLKSGVEAAGRHHLMWQAGALPSGLYFCRMEAGEFSAIQRMVLVK